MRRLVLALVLAIMQMHPLRAADPAPDPAASEADRTAIRRVINDQIAAFQRDDAATAFSFAAPNIQAMFGDPGHFMAMVQRAYQPVYRPRSVSFGKLLMVDGALVQKVELIGPDGLPRTALYTMEHEHDGTWRIDGCALVEGSDVGA